MKRTALATGLSLAISLAGLALAGAPGQASRATGAKAKAPAGSRKTPGTEKAPGRGARTRAGGDGGTSLELGTLELNVKGTVTVYLDGRELGQPPFKPVKVLAGKHQLRLVNEEMGIDQTQELEILPGQRSTLEIGIE